MRRYLMSIVLNPGFSGYISIGNDYSRELYREEVHSFEEAKNFIDFYGKSVQGCSLLRATLIPLRTDNWKDFAKDFFLPTFVNHALKVDRLASRIFVSFFAIILDVFTFIPRLIASPFAVIYNYKNKSDHPLINLIKDNSDFELSIDSGFFEIKLNLENVNIQYDTHLNARTAKQVSIDGYVTVTTKKFHGEIEEESDFNERAAVYKEADGEWDLKSSISGNSDILRSDY